MPWVNADTNTVSDNNTNTWNGYTLRMFIPQAEFVATGGNKIRLTLKPNTTGNNTTIQKMYVGQAHASYSATNPQAVSLTQVLFGGSASVTLTAGGAVVVSDEVTIPIPTSQGFLVVFYMSGSNFYFPTNASAPTGGIVSYRNADDASSATPGGAYTDFSGTQKSGLITLIELFTGTDYTLACAVGAFSLTGIAATLIKISNTLIAAAGSYAVTGMDAVLRGALSMLALQGTYVLTGLDAVLRKNITIAVALGTYVYTGFTIVLARKVVAAGKFTLRRARFILQKLRITQPTLSD